MLGCKSVDNRIRKKKKKSKLNSVRIFLKVKLSRLRRETAEASSLGALNINQRRKKCLEIHFSERQMYLIRLFQ